MFKKKVVNCRIVKGVSLSVKEYKAFINYLNDNNVQSFNRLDVLHWLEFYDSKKNNR